jgi:Y-X(10)_GDL-associated radical SAM protein
MYCAIQTGGRNLTPKRLAAAVDAGLQGVGVSLDGMRRLHDRVRGVPGSFDQALDTLRRAKAAGLKVSVNTQIGSETMADLTELMETIIDSGARHWQIQLTVAMGNAADNDHLLLQPYQLRELMPLLSRLYSDGGDRGLLMVVGNNIGYFGPYEHIWRGLGDERVHWSGCTAGHTVLALEADGTVKGCPSLATNGFAGGNIRNLSLDQIWATSPEIHFGRLRSVDDLWGFCRSCYYADVCRGGCTWTSHSLLGRPGNNPFCHYRVLQLEKQGLRERIVKRREASPEAFGVGEFELIEELIPETGQSSSTVVHRTSARNDLVQLTRRSNGAPHSRDGRIPPSMEVCRVCNEYVWRDEVTCPHCGGNIPEAAELYTQQRKYREELMTELSNLIEAARRQVRTDQSLG